MAKRKSMIIAAVIAFAAYGISGCSTLIPSGEDVLVNGSAQSSDISTDNGLFYPYLKKLYKNADEYYGDLPVYINRKSIGDSGYHISVEMYKEYAVLDLDGDGEDELLMCMGRSSGDYENKESFNIEEAVGKMTDVFVLCKSDGSEIKEDPDRISLGTKSGIAGGEITFRNNGCAVTEADETLKSHGIKYDKVGLFNKDLCEEMGVGNISGSYYIGYSYFEMYDRIEYDWFSYGSRDHADFMIPLYEDGYKKHLSVIESGGIVDISGSDRREFTPSGIGISGEELKTVKKPEDDIFLKYLADIYGKEEIINGYPVEIMTGEDNKWGSWRAYKKYAIADFDGDGTDELLIFGYGPYNGGMMNMDEDDSFTESVYPFFDMYEISATGEVAQKDEEPYKIHGDLWLMGGVSYIDRTGFDFYDNGVFRYRGRNMEDEEAESYYIYDDDIFRKIERLGHKMYTEYTGMEDWIFGSRSIGSALCYKRDKDGNIRRMVGSHQDGSYDLISEEEYKSEVSVLTGGNELDTYFKDVSAENIGADQRTDTFKDRVYRETDIGLGDITLTGTLYYDNSTVDAFGRPEPVAVLKLDLPFIYIKDEENDILRVDEVQIGVDTSVYDTLDIRNYEGKRVSVTGTSFPAVTEHHHRLLVMMAKEVDEAKLP